MADSRVETEMRGHAVRLLEPQRGEHGGAVRRSMRGEVFSLHLAGCPGCDALVYAEEGVAVRAPAGNAPALAQALLPLIESAAIRQDQGARARAYGEDMGSWRDMAARTIGIYEALLAARA
mgnify:CR=1 FL=1